MNIGEWIFKRSLTEPDLPFVKESDRELNNREFNRRVNRTANALIDLGLTKGRRVAAMVDNSIEYLEILFACAKTGIIFVPLSVQSAVPDLDFILNDCTPKVMIYGPQVAEHLDEFKRNHPRIDHFLQLRPENGEDSFFQLVDRADDKEPIPADDVTAHDPFFIIYMPSTSGDPRGAVLSHGNILFGAVHSILSYGINKTYKSLVVAPLSQIGALVASVLPVVYGGGSLIIEPFYHPSKILSLITREKVNYLFAVPVMYQMLAKAPEWDAADFSHVHLFISGGAPMAAPLIQKYHEEKGIRFPQGYGMTETGRLTSLDLDDSARKAGSVGKEVFHVFLRIVDEEDCDVPVGEIGEIIVKGPNVFGGYWNRPEDTQEAFKDGWFHTADLGRRDEEGFIYLAGRKMETIISSGRNIYPIEVERSLTALPGVKDAAAVGLPDPGKGQIVVAAVAIHEGATVTKDILLDGLQGKIAAYKIPKTILIMDKLPRNPVGQVDRDKVRKLFEA